MLQGPILLDIAKIEERLKQLTDNASNTLRQKNQQEIHLQHDHITKQALDLKTDLPTNCLSEWGMPLGQKGRQLILKYLARRNGLVLWIYSEESMEVYPPAWHAQGMNLQRIYFARCSAPLTQLKAVFFEPLFQSIILDCPQDFSRDDQNFLAYRARKQKQSICILRNFFLSQNMGNPFAKIRLNCFYNHTKQEYRIHPVRGPLSQDIILTDQSLSSYR